MQEINQAYGIKALNAWIKSNRKSRDLSDSKSTPEEANNLDWQIDSFARLVEDIAFLTVMNKRSVLLYRGQSQDYPLIPVLFRDQWFPFESNTAYKITDVTRPKYYECLREVGKLLYEFSLEQGSLPRWRGMRKYSVIQWAVAQHYAVWPTPLIDLTSSLRVAASFALGMQRHDTKSPASGYLYIFGFPANGKSDEPGPISSYESEQLVLARLQACCPPAAIRAHLQDGYLAGDYMVQEYEASHLTVSTASFIRDKNRSNLQCRLIAKIMLYDNGPFWNDAHPVYLQESLLPADDPFGIAVQEKLQPRVRQLAEKIGNVA
jgi:hypothetical protein